MELKYTVCAIAENPDFPYVAVGYDNGVLELISAYNPEKITVMASFNLTNNPIKTVKFFEQGRIIIAGFLDIGEFFLIEVWLKNTLLTNLFDIRYIEEQVFVNQEICNKCSYQKL